MFVLIALVVTGSANADPLRLFNSGTDTNGVIGPVGSIDPRITIVDRTDGIVGTSAYAVSTYIGWVPNSSDSLWLCARPDKLQAGNAQWTFRVPIDLTGYALDTVSIQARVTSDNAILWTRLNGQDIGFVTDISAFIAWHSLALTNGFVAGQNYLDFRVDDGGPPSGFRIELSGSAVPAPTLSIEISQIRLCWHSTSNRIYQVQYRSELTTNSWVDLEPQVLGDGGTICVSEDVVSPQRFYRVVVLP